MVEYEALVREPTAVLAPLLDRLHGRHESSDANRSSWLLGSSPRPVEQKLHKQDALTYVNNPDEVRAMQPARLDFKISDASSQADRFRAVDEPNLNRWLTKREQARNGRTAEKRAGARHRHWRSMRSGG